MNPAEHLRHIRSIQDRARQLSDQVGESLQAGTPPERLVPLLKTQVETLSQLQNSLARLAVESTPEFRAAHREHLKQLKETFQNLADASTAHHQQATRKGIRLTGIGGKPYVPARPKKAP